jgi:hypothetical protein
MEALLLVAERGRPTMFARIGVMRALNRHVESVFKPARKSSLGTAAVETLFVTRADKSERARSAQQQSRWGRVLEKQRDPANGAVSYRASEPV